MIWLLATALASPRAECAAAEREGRFAEMAVLCAACEEPFCAERLAWLALREDVDGGYAGLIALDRARRGEGEAPAVARAFADADTAPTVRAEAGLWLADREPERAVALLTEARVLAPEASRRQVELALAEALAEAGDLAGAEAVEAPHRLGPTRPSPVQALATRRVRRVAAGASGIAVLAAVLASARGVEVRPLGLLPLGLLVLGAATYATLYAEGAGASLWLFFPGAALLHLLAARALARDPAGWRRALVALGTVGWGYLSLWWVDGLAEVGL